MIDWREGFDLEVAVKACVRMGAGDAKV